MLDLDVAERRSAIEQLVSLLTSRFSGEAVARLLPSARQAELAVTDGEALSEHLAELLHVSEVSDRFGFEVLGWVAAPGYRPAGPCPLEVKSGSADTFRLSTAEWQLAEPLHNVQQGARCVVLVVARGRKGGPPTRMDLLPDPVGLVRSRRLHQRPDG